MKIKVFYPEFDGSIRLSKQELQDLLDEVYKEGYDDGRNNARNYWTYPSWTYTGGGITNGNIVYTNDSISITSSNNYDPNTCTVSSSNIPHTFTADVPHYEINFAEAKAE